MTKILLVDDLPENLWRSTRCSSRWGTSWFTRARATEALKRLLKDEFAVILLDVQMPEMDGFETAALIKGRERTQDLPIIFLTAHLADTEHIFRGYSEGAVDYILKPFEPERAALEGAGVRRPVRAHRRAARSRRTASARRSRTRRSAWRWWAPTAASCR